MKNNYNIRLNPKKLSSEDIAKHQNFDALLQQFEATEPEKINKSKGGRIRQMYIWAGAIAAIFAGLLIFSQFSGNNDDFKDYHEKSEAIFAEMDYVDPPVPAAIPEFTSQKIDANKGGVYEYRSGSKLVVPAASFVDDKGALVQGEVDIKYREYHDFVDFYLSGIPMVYDSAGVKYNLESAGMMEVYAEKDGQRVKLAPGKTIDVELVSNVNVPANLNVPPKYNIYKLDVENRNWTYQDIDKMQIVEDETQEIKLDEEDPAYSIKKDYQDKLAIIEMNEATELATIEATIPKIVKPLAPKKFVSSSHAFELKFNDLASFFDEGNMNGQDAQEFEAAKKELRSLYEDYSQMLWAVSEQSNISQQRLRTEFSETDGIRIKKVNNRDFEFTLIKGDAATKVIVNPILTGADYDKALVAFNQEFARFEEQRAARESQLAEKKAILKNKIDGEKTAAEADYQEKLAHFQNTNQNQRAVELILKRKVVNRFQATSLGIWNCDRPIPPNLVNSKATFKSSTGEIYDGNIGYFVDKSRNTVARFYVTEGTPMSFNKFSDNLVWLITKENKIAVFRPEDFKKIDVKGGKETKHLDFVMTLIDREIKDEADAREVLYF